MKLKGSILLMAILAIALLMPAIAGAQQYHGVQVFETAQPADPIEGIWVDITIQTGDDPEDPLDWTTTRVWTNASGAAGVNMNQDPGADIWHYEVQSGPGGYNGEDPNPGDVEYPKTTILLDEEEGGMR
ncbi:hypothetical protein ACFLQV_01540 [Calditrichota bacterium]